MIKKWIRIGLIHIKVGQVHSGPKEAIFFEAILTIYLIGRVKYKIGSNKVVHHKVISIYIHQWSSS